MQAEEEKRTERPVVGRDTSHAQGHHQRFVGSSFSASYSGWDDDKAWSSQEWKADELMDDRTVKPVVFLRARAHEFQSRFSREHKHVILEEEENHDTTVRNRIGFVVRIQIILGNDKCEKDKIDLR